MFTGGLKQLINYDNSGISMIQLNLMLTISYLVRGHFSSDDNSFETRLLNRIIHFKEDWAFRVYSVSIVTPFFIIRNISTLMSLFLL